MPLRINNVMNTILIKWANRNQNGKLSNPSTPMTSFIHI
jgi:hypothetical protein